MANEEPKPKTGSGPRGAWEAVGPIVAALITGVGLLAFVAFFGGAILWDRADQAGLPGTQAVALMPRSTLLATGGHFLVWAFLLSAIAVAVLWLVDILFFDHEQNEIQAAVEAAAFADLVRDSDDEQDPATFEAGEPKAVGKAKRLLAEAILKEKDAQSRLEKMDQALLEARPHGEAATTNAQGAVNIAMEKMTTRSDKRQQAQEALAREILKRNEQWSLTWRGVGLAVLLAAGEVVILLNLHHLALNGRDYALLLAAIVLTSLLAVAVYHTTQKFLWFAVAAFLSVAVFQGVATHYDIGSEPMVEPAAVLMGRLPPISGVFVAETDDRIYVGVSKDGVVGNSASLVALPRGRVTGLAIGKLTRVSDDDATKLDATELARELVKILCSQVPKVPALPKQATAKEKQAAVKERRALPKCQRP